METTTTFDFSVRTAPNEWSDAAADAPESDEKPLYRKRVVGDLPHRYEFDGVTSSISALAISIAVGVSWYVLEINNALQTPWISVILGLLIAVAVRLGAGPHVPEARATLSVIFYIATLLTVAYMIERYQFVAVYGTDASIAGGERGLVRDRLTQPGTVAAWAIGLLTTIQASYLLRKR